MRAGAVYVDEESAKEVYQDGIAFSQDTDP